MVTLRTLVSTTDNPTNTNTTVPVTLCSLLKQYTNTKTLTFFCPFATEHFIED